MILYCIVQAILSISAVFSAYGYHYDIRKYLTRIVLSELISLDINLHARAHTHTFYMILEDIRRCVRRDVAITKCCPSRGKTCINVDSCTSSSKTRPPRDLHILHSSSTAAGAVPDR